MCSFVYISDHSVVSQNCTMADPRRRSKRRLRILFKVNWIQRKEQKRGPPLPECHPVKNEHHHGMKAWDFFWGWGVFVEGTSHV